MKIINTVKTAIRWDKSVMIFAESEWKHIGLPGKDEAWYLARMEPEVETDPPFPPYCAWDTCDITEDEVKRLREEDPELSEEDARKQIYEDPDLLSFALDDLHEDLTHGMKEVNPDCYWKAEVRNFGWRKLSGSYKGGEIFHSKTGKDLLGRMLPNCDCTYKIYIDYDGTIRINNAHHDSPMLGGENSEWYIIKPQFDREDQE
jgi:hypothetical protein